MTTQTENKVAGDVVLYEAPSRYSREVYEIDTGQTLVCGELFELSSGKAVTLSVTETNCAGVILEGGTAGDKVPCLVRHAIVQEDQLDYGDADSEPAARAALLTLGIVVRSEAT